MARMLQELIDDAREELKQAVIENGGTHGMSDSITEIADGSVPVYYSTLLEMAQDDVGLALAESSLGANNAIEMIQHAIYEAVSEALYDALGEFEVYTCERCGTEFVTEDSDAYTDDEFCSRTCELEQEEAEEETEETPA